MLGLTADCSEVTPGGSRGRVPGRGAALVSVALSSLLFRPAAREEVKRGAIGRREPSSVSRGDPVCISKTLLGAPGESRTLECAVADRNANLRTKTLKRSVQPRGKHKDSQKGAGC